MELPLLLSSDEANMALHFGDQSTEVIRLQEMLSRCGFYLGRIDGSFGRLTESAVREFQRKKFVTGIADDSTLSALSEMSLLPFLSTPAVPRPENMEEVKEIFGEIQFVDSDGGRIKITNGWAEENVVSVRLPIVGKEMVHRKLVPIFQEVFEQIQRQGLADEVRQFAVWSPRHKMNDPKRELSLHSWAIACDVNWSENPPGQASKLHPGIVSVFEAAGFFWGARFQSKIDPMHFQFATGI